MKNKSEFFRRILTHILIFSMIFSVMAVGFSVQASANLEEWDGTVAEAFAGGAGTKTDPFLIENGGQLYKMVSEYSNVDVTSRTEAHTYFEITKDINLNNQQWYRFANNSTNGTQYIDAVQNASVGFNGIIEGNGHTVYNLYRTGSGSRATGLIPLATQGAEIHNLNLNGGTISGGHSSNGYAAFIGGAKGSSTSVPVVIENCSVTGFTISATASKGFAGGFVGYAYSQSIEINNCYINNSTITSGYTDNPAAALICYAGGNSYENTVNIVNSYCVGTTPIGKLSTDFRKVVTYKNVYTDISVTSTVIGDTAGIKTLTTEQMKGENAKTYMTGFDFNTVWQVGAVGEYLSFWSAETVGNIWNGTVAVGYASGIGTESNPYIIKTAEQLYLLASSDTAATENNYYKLDADIKLANIYDGWEKDNVYQWVKKTVDQDGAGYGDSFAGYFDGNGYTVSGLFYNDADTDTACAYGLFPVVSKGAVIKNVNIDNAYINVSESGDTYVGAVAGYANVLEADAENTLNWVQFVNCAATNSTIGILGGANRGVKLELCSSVAESIAPSTATCINCNKDFDYTKDDIVVITVANGEALTLVRVKLLNATDEYITDINCDGEFDIRDLVRLKKYASELETEETHMLDEKKILFVGNSFTYYGKTVLEKSASVLTQEARSNDQGFFYQLCKENGADVSVTNWTFGSHDFTDLFESESCDAKSECTGENHLSYLTDRSFDYVILQESHDATEEAFLERCTKVINIFKNANPDTKFIFLVHSSVYTYNDGTGYQWKDAVDNLKEQGVTIANWGSLVCDVMNGVTAVPGATQTYNKNSFIISKSASDGYHPNMLTGYITTLMTYCAITGESAVGQEYSFCNDSSINSAFNFTKFINSYYTYNNATTNFPEIFASNSDMNGIQQLIDQYLG